MTTTSLDLKAFRAAVGSLREAVAVVDDTAWFDRQTPGVRNTLVAGVDLNSLVGAEFEIQGVRFVGVEHCKPCHWMNSALGPGAEDWLQGRGGLRARILTDGVLQRAA